MSEQVKRYDSIGYDGMSALMEEHVEGDYVSCDDYATLQSECERLRSELATVKKVAYWNLELLSSSESLRAELAAIKAQEPVAVLRYSRNVAGLENEMPLVISCNDLADGEHRVYALPAVAPQLTTEPATAS